MLKKFASIRRSLRVRRRIAKGSSSEAFRPLPFTKNKDRLFEHPAWYSLVVPDAQISDVFACLQSLSAAC